MLPESKKPKTIQITEKRPNVNPYYLLVSEKFKVAKYITLCVLVVFLLSAVVLFRNEITVENLRYLFKDFEVGDNVNINTSDLISYDSDQQVNLALYKGDLVIVGSSYFYLSDLQGNKRLNEDSSFSNPVILSGDKYLLIYGLSEYTYSIYNTFSLLHTESFEYPITNAALSDNGMYAIATRTAEYRSVVYLYNADFEKIGAVYKDKYVVDIQFNSSGTELLITSLYSKDGTYCTEIVNYVPFSEVTNASTTVDNSMPIKTGYNKAGGYSVVFSDKVCFYNENAELITTYSFSSDMMLTHAVIDSEYTILAYNENIVGDEIRILVFDPNGSKIYDGTINGQLKKIKSFSGSLYALLNGQLCKINISDGKAVNYGITRNAIDILVHNENTVFVCYYDHTSRINIE